MSIKNKTKEELIKELQALQQENNFLKTLYDKDIIGRKQAEETLDKERVLLRTIIDNFPNSIFVKDKKYRKIVVNLEHARRVTEHLSPATPYSVEDFLGKTDFDFYPKELAERFLIEDQKVIEEGQSVINQELLSKEAKGQSHWELISKIPLRDRNREIIGLVGISNDITGRKLAEQALLQSEENFHRSISESPLGIRIDTIDGKTIYVNEAFLDIFEFNSLEEFTSTPAINRYTPESYAQNQERKEKIENGHEVFDYEVSIIRKNSEIRNIKVSKKEVLWNGKKHYQLINIDITEQKKLTLELIAAKEHAESADRLKTVFLANMSHEIRTPMNGILGFADLLKEPDLTGEKQQEYIRIIEKSGVRMLNIINDIVDISKIESGLMEVTIRESNINEQIEYIYTFFKPEVEKKGIQLFFKNALPTKESNIKTDREKIFAILTNLLKNAIKFTNKGSIEFGYNLKADREPFELEFFVKDTGIGIPKGKDKVIFERFIQADIYDKGALQGSGLGLTISKAYVELLGGEIRVDSEEGRGSIFYFTIPFNTEPEGKNIVENDVPSDIADNKNENLKILIVEDDETSEMLLTMSVIPYSREVLKARTGFEAVEACHNNPDIDLILMDLQMPEMNGYEATRQIRKFNKDVVIIAQTAFALTSDREKAIEEGCNDYISKPIKKDELLALIQKYFQ